MSEIAGLGKTERANLASVVRETRGTIAVSDAAEILAISRTAAAKMLSRWASKGWVSRIRRGMYIPVPLESRTVDVPVEDVPSLESTVKQLGAQKEGWAEE